MSRFRLPRHGPHASSTARAAGAEGVRRGAAPAGTVPPVAPLPYAPLPAQVAPGAATGRTGPAVEARAGSAPPPIADRRPTPPSRGSHP